MVTADTFDADDGVEFLLLDDEQKQKVVNWFEDHPLHEHPTFDEVANFWNELSPGEQFEILFAEVE